MRRPKASTVRQSRWLVAASMACAIMAMSGCGTGSTSVSGMVTMDGQPLGKALVRFFPSGPVGQTAATYTDAAGRYRAIVSPAPLRVVISARRVVGQEKNDLVPGGPLLDVTEEIVPPCYSDLKRTVLEIAPAAHRNTMADFALTATGTTPRPAGR
jgi:hypothetical protein